MNIFQQILLNNSKEVFSICFILIGALLATAITDFFFSKVISKRAPSKRAKTLVSVIQNASKAIVWGITIVLILSSLHVNIMPLLASAGIVGLAIGFGSQVLVKDIISGIFFIFENQFNSGDIVRIGTVEGTVEHVGLRTISIRDRDTGALHIIPNGSVGQLTNLSNNYSCINIPITVSSLNDVDKVLKLMEATGKQIEGMDQFKDIISHPIKVFALDSLGDNKMTLRAVIKTHPNKQEAVAQHYRYELKKSFDKNKIALL